MKRRPTDKINLRGVATSPGTAEIRKQLNKIIGSPDFKKARRLRDFLVYVVNEALEGKSASLKAYTIGVEVFERPDNFDPITDTIVRVNAGKLRRSIERYYSGPGRQDAIIISIPKGGYVPLFKTSDYDRERNGENRLGTACDLVDHIQGPTVAVLPLKDLGIDASREFLIHGFGEELSMALSRFSNLRVISYHSTAEMKPGKIGLKEACRTLSATFAVMGSVYQTVDTLRINVQLVRADSSEQVWSHRYERLLSENALFSTIDEIVQCIVAMIADDYGIIPKIVAAASWEKAIDDLHAYEAVMRYHHYGITLDPKAYEEAFKALSSTIATNPKYAMAWALIAILYFDAVTFSFQGIESPLENGETAVHKAILIDPNCQHAYFAKCYLELMKRNEKAVILSAKKIIDLNPNAGFLVGTAGWFLAMAGQFEEGFSYIEQSKSLSPVTPTWFHFPRYLFHYVHGNYTQALDEARAFGLSDFFWSPLMHATVFGQQGKIDEAKKAYHKLVSLIPDFPDQAHYYIRFFVINDGWVDKILDGLFRAGLKRV